MEIKLNPDAIAAIERILNRKGNAVAYPSKDGVVIAEDKRKIEYRTSSSRS